MNIPDRRPFPIPTLFLKRFSAASVICQPPPPLSDPNPRLTGGVWTPSRLCFLSQISQNQRRGAKQFLAHLSRNYFCTCCKSFKSRSLKVRSPGHAKWPHLRKSLNASHSYTDWMIALKLSEIEIRNSIYNTYVSEFVCRYPKVRLILQPLH